MIDFTKTRTVEYASHNMLNKINAKPHVYLNSMKYALRFKTLSHSSRAARFEKTGPGTTQHRIITVARRLHNLSIKISSHIIVGSVSYNMLTYYIRNQIHTLELLPHLGF